MAIIQNRFYHILFQEENMMKILIKLEEYKNQFYPQKAKELSQHIQNMEPLQKENPYQAVLEQLNELMTLFNIKDEQMIYQKQEVDVQNIYQFIKEIEKRVNDIKDVIYQIENEKDENKQAIQLLNHLRKEDLSLDSIQELKYITLRFGRLPIRQENKMQYYQNENFIYKELSRDDEYIWIVYCALNHELGEIDNIFTAIDFKPINIPEFAHGKIDDAIEELNHEYAAMDQYIDDLELRIKKIKNENKQQILTYYDQISYLKKLYNDSQYMIDLKDKITIYLFSPLNRKEMTDIFENMASVVELPVNIYEEKGICQPIILKNHHFIQPFEALIKFKSGDHFDPTAIIAIMMMLSLLLLLGDLGVGVVFILLSVLLKGKNIALLQRIGLAILIGGLFNATVFYQKPIYALGLLPNFLSMNMTFKFMVFIVMNVIVYIVMMFIKNIVRKKMGD